MYYNKKQHYLSTFLLRNTPLDINAKGIIAFIELIMFPVKKAEKINNKIAVVIINR